MPDFFRRGNRFLVEVSWRVDGRGKPMTGAGRFRYPIGYPAGSHEARTGHGLFYNAPLVSDTERHGPARNDSTNDDLREACHRLAIDALAYCAVPRWGPSGLESAHSGRGCSGIGQRRSAPAGGTRPSRCEFPRSAGTRPCRCLSRGALVAASPVPFALHRSKRTTGPRKYGFAIPVLSWDDDNTIYAPLAVMCPPSEKQLDPRVHPQIIRLLADRKTDGFC